MSRGVSSKITFKRYDQSEQWLLPPSLEELVPENHLVRVVSATVDKIELKALFKAYSTGGGASRYHPQMLLKVLIYCYLTGTYSSRQIAKQCRENVNVMWLAANQKPDFRTINAFRGERLKRVIEEVFTATVKLLYEKGYVKLEKYFVDGTKIESAANKYTFVWKGSVEKYEKKVDEKVRELIKEINTIAEQENEIYGDKDLEELGEGAEVTSKEIKEVAQKINNKLEALAENSETKAKTVKKKLEKAKKALETELLPRKEKYEAYNATFNGRNSFSKTDHDATFMRMKEDAMKNGQLKPGYNVQVGNENTFAIGYDIFADAADMRTLPVHIDNVQKRLEHTFEMVIADAGYGSEENYEYLERNGSVALVKYGSYHQQRKKSFKKKLFNSENWDYDSEQKAYNCPAGKRVPYVKTVTKETKNGYTHTIDIYQCHNCEGCPLRERCTKAKEGRTVQRNEKWLAQKKQVNELLDKEENKKIMKRRSVECETVFGQIKGNQHFRRFHVRGREKVGVEIGLLLMGYNIKNLIRKEQEQKAA